MPIVDAHIHLWASNVPSPPHRQIASWSAEEALGEMAEAGVDAAVIQPPNWDPNANAIAEDAAKRYPDRFAILGWFPPEKPESRALVAEWKQRPGQRGLRFTFMRPGQEHWASDGTMEWLWPAAERAGLPIALGAANFLPVVGEIAARFPGLKLAIDHFGMPPRGKDSAAWMNLPQLLALAKHKNIAVKVTGAPGMSSEPYPFPNLHQPIRAIYDSFGPARMFWGTDITRLTTPWRQCVTLFTEELSWLSQRDKELIMGRALCDWLGWNIAP
ncbi:MAG TPA: amidohydrolase family protein [Stellaceae bacterium]|jgi:predicted TIM-barrel fold metal-dependent hydrolase|nr:amidohydrolase family protein [Stellaceae bacterium]